CPEPKALFLLGRPPTGQFRNTTVWPPYRPSDVQLVSDWRAVYRHKANRYRALGFDRLERSRIHILRMARSGRWLHPFFVPRGHQAVAPAQSSIPVAAAGGARAGGRSGGAPRALGWGLGVVKGLWWRAGGGCRVAP